MQFLFALILCLIESSVICSSTGPKRPRISFSWSASYHLSSNGSQFIEEEAPEELSAVGNQFDEVLTAQDLFPAPRKNSTRKNLIALKKHEKSNHRIQRRESYAEAKSEHDRATEKEKESEEEEEELDISPEMKVKIYTGVILATLALIVCVMCLWPIFKCLRTCCRFGNTCCMACWDLCHFRDPGYRFMVLAAKQAGLDPPSPEEYDRFVTGWGDQAPQLMEALMD